MPVVKVRALKLQDVRFGDQWSREAEDRWEYDDFLKNRAWRKGWISFDCALYDAADDRVYLGITSFEADIFKAYDRKSDKFVDLGYARVADKFDAKFHRSLERGSDGAIYGAVALLHCVDKFHEAPGGAIVRYDPKSGSISKLKVPLPHVYIQSIALDATRDIVYCQCFAPEKLASFNLRTGEVRDYGLIGTGIGGMCQPENICLDDDGNAWSSWQLTRAWQNSPGVDCQRLCKIDPQQQRIVFFDHGLPRPDGQRGTVKAEGLFNFHDGHLYASGANGSLYRVNTENGKGEYLGTPVTDRPSRLASLALGKDGNAYGVTGRDGRCELIRFDFQRGKYELLGKIGESGAGGEACWQIHNVVFADNGTLYACENDVPHRSSYLWEISGIV
jgi:streptogramin lyase